VWTPAFDPTISNPPNPGEFEVFILAFWVSNASYADIDGANGWTTEKAVIQIQTRRSATRWRTRGSSISPVSSGTPAD
jgi:hypothetical protein